MSRRLSWAGIALLVATSSVLSACGGAGGAASGGSEAAGATNPLRGATFHVDPAGNAVRAVEELRSQGDPAAEVLEQQIASHPTATWVTPDPAAVFAQVEALTK